MLEKGTRYAQLDSIRGLASLVVYLHHIYLVTPVLPLILWYSPLRILVNGHGSVILFFVLSGFVLYLPFANERLNFSYSSYLIKRVFRIYVPYLVAIILSIVALQLFATGAGIEKLSEWFNLFWRSQPDASLILEHLLLLGNVHSDSINTVIWSLIHEMRISLIFPLFALIVRMCSWKISLVLCVLLSSVAGGNAVYPLMVSHGFHTNIFDSFHYLSLFILGALLNKHKHQLIQVYVSQSRRNKMIALFAILSVYVYAGAFDNLVKNPLSYIVSDYGIAVSACAIIIFSLGSIKMGHILSWKPIVFLGNISYSLYLYHFIILFSLIYAFNEVLPIWQMYLLSIPIVMVVSYLSWFFIENNSVRIGKKISNTLTKSNTAAVIPNEKTA
ncbi:peptidoglycan/LPS O-acetylase OafA/YrhL [Paenibacillus sp. DS2015]|uniref:acyltransferase family protein n=1 Tax=Paenibacillus sp. DS2015 TaxID=3373917 RepID=UPI003D216912